MNKRTILALVLISLIFILWDDYLVLVGLGPKESDLVEETTPILTNGEQRHEIASPTDMVAPSLSAPDRNSMIETIPGDAVTPDIVVTTTDELEQFIIVETETFRARLTTYGVGLTSYIIKPERLYIQEEVELIPADSRPRPFYRFWTYDGPIDTDKLKFRFGNAMFSNGSTIRVESGRERQVSFVTNLSNNSELEVIYTFTGDGFGFTYEVKTSGLSNAWVRPDAEIYWKGGLADTESGAKHKLYGTAGYSMANVYYSGDVLEKLKLDPKETVIEEMTSGQTKWGSVRTKYFLAALIPQGGMGTGASMESVFDSTFVGKEHPNLMGVGIKIPLKGGDPSLPVYVYLGPLDDKILIQVEPTLELAMTWGVGIGFFDAILSPLSRAILWTLKSIHKAIPNYGVCVILLSIIIKIVIWPLTRKSYQSMAAMQRLQPQMQALRDKHGKDQQRLQREIMQLYKSEKVNPMGGCLPMLLQMPLLYALFTIFRATIEFRGAPFVFWIQDLSMPDAIMQLPFNIPLYGAHVTILPVIMGITTFFQSKATMTDPNQKMMLYFMPIFMTLIFNNFPSGLTLYYTLFNIWTLLQQKYTATRQTASKS